MEPHNQSLPSDPPREASRAAAFPTRRQVLGACSGCALACATSVPRVVAAWGDPIPVGSLKDYAKDEISEKYIQHNFFVTRHKGLLFATTATCPHKENYLLRDPKNPRQIVCSGHDAVFDPAGKPTGGPVRQGLIRFGIAVDKEGTVRVDPNKKFPEARWKETGSFISIRTTASATDHGSQERVDQPTAATSSAREKTASTKEKAVLREWSDSSGSYKVQAYFVGLANGVVKLRRADDGRLVDVPLNRLSDQDKKWLESRSK